MRDITLKKIKMFGLHLTLSGIGIFTIQSALAAETDISNMPLANSTGQTVSPNIQFIIDDSGSMAWNYAPDALTAEDYYCKSARRDRSYYTTRCAEGEAPYFNAQINTIYYNPENRYDPVILPEGYSYSRESLLGKPMNAANTNNWKSVPNDIYRIASTGNTNLTTNYPHARWCNSTSGWNQSCKLDIDYSYPNSTYFYRSNTTGAANYYTINLGEYCSDRNLTDCIKTSEPDGNYIYPAYIRFCTDSSLSVCQKNYVKGSYIYARYATMGATSQRATASLIVSSSSSNATITNITVNGVKINASNISGSTNINRLASNIRNSINNSNKGFSATVSGNTVTITAPNSDHASYNGKTISITYSGNSTHTIVTRNFSGGSDGGQVPGYFQKITIEPGLTYTKYPNRTDCAGNECSYAEEMTNFANWYAYYRTRMQLVKTTVASTLGNLSNDYRLGIFSLNGNISDVNIGNLSTSQREAFLNSLFATRASGGTPLRQALAKAGNIYAGKYSFDPVQYSCQQNFTIMATDGYWNGGYSGYTGPKYGGDTSVLPPFYSPNNRNEVTLADIAYYYYYTDLRPTGSKNKQGVDVSDNNVPAVSNNIIEGDFANWQHMTTFTLGLGLSGVLDFDESYKTTEIGDYYNLKQGSVNWPQIVSDQQTTIDDLWHTAINGHGQYFSAKDPSSVTSGLVSALASIGITTGTGAAAATSNLEPIAGDNFVYVASYRTRWWDGDLAAYTIDLNDGTIANEPIWSSQTLLDQRIGQNGNVDTRAIYTDRGNQSTILVPFKWNEITLEQRRYFDPDQLSQYHYWPPNQKNTVTGENLLNYLRGHREFEDKEKTGPAANKAKAFRAREHILGDIINAKPEFVGTPAKRYADEGYAEYLTAMSSRRKVVYVAANDGMLHAFDAENGSEIWAYVPSEIMKKMYKLADNNYTSSHEYFTDGAPVVGDVFDPSTQTWKSILVAGFNAGGRGYYALDVTNPNSPKLLWKKNERDASFGYSFGKPIFGKNRFNNWVVLLSSGYNNNVGQGDGRGWLYSINPITGDIVESRGTYYGSLSSPSGFAKFNTWVDDVITNNKIETVYGGDLEGNMFKFNMLTGSSAATRMFNVDRPITVQPELGIINNTRVLFFSTGKYIGQTDLYNTDENYIFAVKDDMTNLFIPSIRNRLQHQAATELTPTTRGGSTQAVDWVNSYGWYITMRDRGERGNIDPMLQLGTLVVVTNVPVAEACNPSGYSWMYQLDYRTGSVVQVDGSTEKVIAHKLNSTTVGLNVVRLPNGTVVILRSRSDSIKPDTTTMKIGGGGGSAKRMYWRVIN